MGASLRNEKWHNTTTHHFGCTAGPPAQDWCKGSHKNRDG